MLNFKAITAATLKARAARPELKMLGVQVEAGKCDIVHYPTWGNVRTPKPVVLRAGIPVSDVVEALEAIAGGAA